MNKFLEKINRVLLRELVGYGGLAIGVAGLIELVYRGYTNGSVVMMVAGMVLISIAVYEGKK